MTETKILTQLLKAVRAHEPKLHLELHDEEGLSLNIEGCETKTVSELISEIQAADVATIEIIDHGSIFITNGEGEDVINDFTDTPLLRAFVSQATQP